MSDKPNIPNSTPKNEHKQGKPKNSSKGNGKGASPRKGSPSERTQQPELDKNNNKAKQQSQKPKEGSQRNPKKSRARDPAVAPAVAPADPEAPKPQYKKDIMASGDPAFAGSSFHESPAASSLPQPSFAKGMTTPDRSGRPNIPTGAQSSPINSTAYGNGVSHVHPQMMHMQNPQGYHMPYMPIPMGMHPMAAPPMGYPMMTPQAMHHPTMHAPMPMMPMYPQMMSPGPYAHPPLQQPSQQPSSDTAKAAQ